MKRKLIISPSILSADFAKLAEDVKTVADAGAEYIHIDVMDGHFVPNITIGAGVVKSLRKYTNVTFDVHLMIDTPEKYIEDFIKAGSDIITIHVESTEKIDEIIDTVKTSGKKIGLSVKPNTPIEKVFTYLDKIDMVLIMSVEPGFGGQKFMPVCLEKAEKLNAELKKHSHNIDIEVDGGINLETAKQAIDAGINILVAGSAIYSGNNYAKNVKDFLNLTV